MTEEIGVFVDIESVVDMIRIVLLFSAKDGPTLELDVMQYLDSVREAGQPGRNGWFGACVAFSDRVAALLVTFLVLRVGYEVPLRTFFKKNDDIYR